MYPPNRVWRPAFQHMIVPGSCPNTACVVRDWKHCIHYHNKSWCASYPPSHHRLLIGELRARYIYPPNCSRCPQFRPTKNYICQARHSDLPVRFVIARERSERGDLAIDTRLCRTPARTQHVASGVQFQPETFGHLPCKASVRRARQSAREAGYWKHCTLNLGDVFVCFQSAITPSVIHRRIEGTIHLSTKLLTVPSISPYEKLHLSSEAFRSACPIRHRERA